MPLWIDAVAAVMALTGLVSIFTGVRTAYRRAGRNGLGGPLGLSIGDQAERWLQTQRSE